MSEEYLDAFLRETEEGITDLNNALLALESDPDDESAMEEVFRVAHTIKGNAAAMGFTDLSDTAHAVEDLLDAARDGELELGTREMDLAFAGIDAVEEMVAEIEADGASTVTADDVVEDIRALLASDADEGGTTAGDDGTATAPDDDGDGGDGGADGPAVDDGLGLKEPAASAVAAVDRDALTGVDDRVHHARIAVGDDGLPGVDAMFALEAMTEAFGLLATDPSPEEIEDGAFDESFDVFVAASDPEGVEEELDTVGPVDGATVTEITEAVAPASTDDGAAEDAGADATEEDTADADTPDSGADAADDGVDSGADAADGDDDGGEPGVDEGDGGGSESDAGDAGGGDAGGVSADEVKSVRVDIDQLDELHGLVEQLVTSRIKLRRAIEEGDTAAAMDTLGGLDKISSSLQDTVMDMQLIPLKKVVGKFPRLVRDLAREQEKEVEFTIEGEDIELDRTILTRISDPLMHVLRNAVDHGIEPPAEREAAGKPRTGHVELTASRQRDHVIIEVSDDGAGLDADRIREEAIEEGVRTADELDRMDEGDIYDLVFHPGFSTNDEVTDVSGRGVGMDVVHSTVKQLDGSVDVSSTPGEGSTVRFRLPVTVAIVTVLFVRAGDDRYGVPIKAIDEVSRAEGIEALNGNEVVEHGDDLYPVVRLGEALDTSSAAGPDGADGLDAVADGGEAVVDEEGMLLRIREEERQVALHCDEVEDQEEVVVKPLEGVLTGTEGLSGTAVLGDGNIVPILDVMTL